VLDEEDPSRTVDHDGAGTQRRGAREASEMHDPAYDRLKRAPQAMHVLHYSPWS
jgi:hypothetical protein